MHNHAIHSMSLLDSLLFSGDQSGFCLLTDLRVGKPIYRFNSHDNNS